MRRRLRTGVLAVVVAGGGAVVGLPALGAVGTDVDPGSELFAGAEPAVRAEMGAEIGGGPPGGAPGAAARLELPDACTPAETPSGSSPVFPQLGVERAWELSRGAGVTVAVVDSGVVPSSPHLGDDVVLPGFDPMGTVPDSETVTEGPAWSSTDGRTDIDAHGTYVAGLIAARDADGSAVRGVAPESRILPIRVFVSRADHFVDLGYGPDVGRMAEGIRWAADQGAQIISVSMSTTDDADVLREAVAHATAQGALVVASAGNQETTEDEDLGAVRYPAAYPEVLSVTASTIEGEPADASIPGEHVDLAAPGDVAWTVHLDDGDCYIEAGGAASSWSTAYVAGAAALVASRYPEETPAQWRHRLTVTAVRAVPAERDDLLGWGIVAPYDALSFVDDGAAPGPPSPVHEAPTADAATFVPVPERPADPLEAVRGTAAWWVFGAFVVVGGAGLLARAPRKGV